MRVIDERRTHECHNTGPEPTVEPDGEPVVVIWECDCGAKWQTTWRWRHPSIFTVGQGWWSADNGKFHV